MVLTWYGRHLCRVHVWKKRQFWKKGPFYHATTRTDQHDCRQYWCREGKQWRLSRVGSAVCASRADCVSSRVRLHVMALHVRLCTYGNIDDAFCRHNFVQLYCNQLYGTIGEFFLKPYQRRTPSDICSHQTTHFALWVYSSRQLTTHMRR